MKKLENLETDMTVVTGLNCYSTIQWYLDMQLWYDGPIAWHKSKY